MSQKLRLKVSQIKALQAKHGIPNLLQPSGEKLVNVEVLADLYYEGSRSWPDPPTMEQIDDLDVDDLLPAWKQIFSSGPDAEGNG